MFFNRKKRYYYVQRCPQCQSRVTGRYIPRPRYEQDAIFMERNSLAHGELIQFVDYEIVNNCYCEDCGYEWYYDVVTRLISPERYDEEKEVRGTPRRLSQFNTEHPRKSQGKIKRTLFGIFPKY